MWPFIITLLVVCFGFVVVRGAPYVPSHRRQLRRAFTELYDLANRDILVDLGSGDGVVLREARRRGAGAIGYELNPILVLLSRLLSLGDSAVTVRTRDYLALRSLPDGVTVVYAFTTSHSIEPIGRKLREWSRDRDLYLISYGFTLSDKKSLRHTGPMYLYRFRNGA